MLGSFFIVTDVCQMLQAFDTLPIQLHLWTTNNRINSNEKLKIALIGGRI